MEKVNRSKPIAYPSEYREKKSLRDRHRAFLEYFTVGDTAFNVSQSALKAGFAESTATKAGRKILMAALRRDKREAILDEDEPSMVNRVGLTKEELLTELKFVVMQRGDLRSKLRAMTTLLQSEGINLEPPKHVLPSGGIPISINIIPPSKEIMEKYAARDVTPMELPEGKLNP